MPGGFAIGHGPRRASRCRRPPAARFACYTSSCQGQTGRTSACGTLIECPAAGTRRRHARDFDYIWSWGLSTSASRTSFTTTSR